MKRTTENYTVEVESNTSIANSQTNQPQDLKVKNVVSETNLSIEAITDSSQKRRDLEKMEDTDVENASGYSNVSMSYSYIDVAEKFEDLNIAASLSFQNLERSNDSKEPRHYEIQGTSKRLTRGVSNEKMPSNARIGEDLDNYIDFIPLDENTKSFYVSQNFEQRKKSVNFSPNSEYRFPEPVRPVDVASKGRDVDLPASTSKLSLVEEVKSTIGLKNQYKSDSEKDYDLSVKSSSSCTTIEQTSEHSEIAPDHQEILSMISETDK
ncbi:uncharacterized protein LOC109602108 [Aethina tumida]|uniref:uncharacterized protein LOC109602108 n=1 Tax=Aethina tumida TaxID=116153 RepID=UPI00096AD9D1|nr:uncharacterized protein LOC109602108 [Aethina tumida]